MGAKLINGGKKIVSLTDGAGTHEYSDAKKKKELCPLSQTIYKYWLKMDKRPNIKSTSVKTLADFRLVW